MCRRSRFVILAIMLSLCGARAGAEVTLTRAPVEVERRTFNPAHPPADMPPLKGKEAALTQVEFGCSVDLTYRVASRTPQSGSCETALQIRGVTVTLQAKITIWLPQIASVKLAAHEEGHRQINERVYARAEAIARSVAKSLEGTLVAARAATCDQAEKDAVQSASDQVLKRYLDQTTTLAARINDRYDDLTAHGTRVDLSEDEAIRQAFAAEEKPTARTSSAR